MVNNVFNIPFNQKIIIMLITSEFSTVCITLNSRITINKITITLYEMKDESHQRQLRTDPQTLTNDHNSKMEKSQSS